MKTTDATITRAVHHLDGGRRRQARYTYGRTDDYAYNIADADGNAIKPTKDKWTPGTMHIHDLNATLLHLSASTTNG
ncbi:MAG: hypothetical protein CM1200mP34_3020 [Verrucomicrobiales bacterium]|nr:MAG: hypothetical protein CM1200mP34_3020 [Verrucomicrobiales bacterium]